MIAALLEGSTPTGAGLASWGAELVKRGELVAAAVAFEMAVAASPKEPRYAAALGCVLQRRGQSKEAIAAYEKACAPGLNDIDVWTNLAELLLERLDVDAALPALEKALALDQKGVQPAGLRARALIQRALQERA